MHVDKLLRSTVFIDSSNAVRGCIQKFPNWVITKYTLTTTNTRWEATQRVMVAKLTRLTHKIAIQLHLVAESCTICSSRSRRPVLELLDTPSYVKAQWTASVFPAASRYPTTEGRSNAPAPSASGHIWSSIWGWNTPMKWTALRSQCLWNGIVPCSAIDVNCIFDLAYVSNC
jgi:hypothetical protein